jgi:hypothetical protein
MPAVGANTVSRETPSGCISSGHALHGAMTGPIFSFSTTFRPAALAMSGMIMDVLCKEWHILGM